MAKDLFQRRKKSMAKDHDLVCEIIILHLPLQGSKNLK